MRFLVLPNKLPTLLIFGYPLAAQYLGGLIWIKNVADYIERLKIFDVIKISNRRHGEEKSFTRLSEILAILRSLILNPAVAVLDTYGEAAIWMWVLLRVFRPKTKIVIVFHHYEPVSVRHGNCSNLLRKYYSLVDNFTKTMLKNSDKIITVSKSSVYQLEKIVQILDKEKIVLVGCSNLQYSELACNHTKDIDFFCIGRLEKFVGILDIWKEIKKKSPSSKFLMAGRCSPKDRKDLEDFGITHLGIISDSEKTELFKRSKVFLFPSLYEGYGMAVGEAISADMIVVAWRIPVFEERFPQPLANVILVEGTNIELFAKAAVIAKDGYEMNLESSEARKKYSESTTWEEVGRLVVDAIRNVN